MDIVALSSEGFVGCHHDFDVEIAIWSTVLAAFPFPGDHDLLAGIDAGRDIDGNILFDVFITRAIASPAFGTDDFASSSAMGTRGFRLHNAEDGALLGKDGTFATAMGTRGYIAWGFRARAMAMGARLIVGYRQRHGRSIDGIHKGNTDTHKGIAAFGRSAGPRLPSASSKERREDVIKVHIGETLSAKSGSKWIAGSATAGALFEGGVAELVVGSALLVIVKDVVGFLDFLKLLSGIRGFV